MKRRFLIFALLVGVSFAQQMQQNFPVGTIPFAGVPSGSCGPAQTAVNTATGVYYFCNGGTWTTIANNTFPTANTVTESTNTVTATTVSGNWPAAYQPGASISETGCSVSGYNITATILSGGGGGTTLTFTDPTGSLGAGTGCTGNLANGAGGTITGVTAGAGLTGGGTSGGVTVSLSTPIGSGNIPPINLASSANGGVTGNLPVGNLFGGTGASSSTVLFGNGWAAPPSGTLPSTTQDTGTYKLGGSSPNFCGRVQDLSTNSTTVDARNDLTGGLGYWPCGAVNMDPLVQNARNFIFFGTGNGSLASAMSTDVSQTLSAYDVWQGIPTVLVGGGVGSNLTSGTLLMASSVFPGNTFTANCAAEGSSACAGINHLGLTAGSSGSSTIPTLILPGWKFTVVGEALTAAGELPVHRVLPCGVGSAPCYEADPGVPQSNCGPGTPPNPCWSAAYAMSNGTAITDASNDFTFVPNMGAVTCTSGAPCTLNFYAPITSLGDATMLNSVSESGGHCGNCNSATTGTQVTGLSVSGGSASGFCQGGLELVGQEQSWYRQYYVTNCAFGLVLDGPGADQESSSNGGSFDGINVNYSGTFGGLYPSGLVSPVEIDGGYYAAHRWTINAVGVGSSANVTSFTGTSGSLVFTTASNNLYNGETAWLSGFSSPNTGLNAQQVTVSSVGSTTFTATVTGSGYNGVGCNPCGSVGMGAQQLANGVIHITNAWGSNYGHGGRVELDDMHVEGCDNTVCGGGTIATGTQDCFFLDTTSGNGIPTSITGTVQLSNINGASGAHSCVNEIHVASDFVGSLTAINISPGTGQTQLIKDDINGVVIAASDNPNGGSYTLAQDGTFFTNFNCNGASSTFPSTARGLCLGQFGVHSQIDFLGGTETAASPTPFESIQGIWNTTGTGLGTQISITNTASAIGSLPFSVYLSGSKWLGFGTTTGSGAPGVDIQLNGAKPDISLLTANAYLTMPLMNFSTGTAGVVPDCKVNALSIAAVAQPGTNLCSWNLGTIANKWAWSCDGIWETTSGTTPTMNFGVNYSQTPTLANAAGTVYSANASAAAPTATQASTQAATTGGLSIFGSNITPGASATYYQFHLFGNFTSSATAGTFAINAIMGGTTPVGNVTGTCHLE